MTSQDVLYLSISMGFIVLVLVVSYAFFQLALILRSIREVVESVGDTAKDWRIVKNSMKFGVLTFMSRLFSR